MTERVHLFRYRDLIAKTLDEHRSLIDEHGYCWWGWWKRPSEDARQDVWDELAMATSGNKTVKVGLYDSGADLAHLATIDRVIKPQADEFGVLQQVRPPKNQELAIPSYYRSSNFSRAWFRIKRISDQPMQLFGEWSYDSPPPLPGYSDRQLAEFRNKAIAGGSELRAMDTTIWTIRVAVDTDRRERVLAASILLREPLDSSPVPCTGDWILHITDPHFATGGFRGQHAWRLESEGGTGATMFDSIATSLLRVERPVGAVLLTGDLTFLASADEFDAARKALLKFVTGDLSLSLEHLVIIPGNHDVKWTNEKTYDSNSPVENAPKEATEEYRAFYRLLYGFEANEDLSMSRRYVFPGANVVDVIAVNSSSLEHGKDFLSGMGRVQEQALDRAFTRMTWSRPTAALRIVALHHHVMLTEDIELAQGYGAGFGIAVDAPRILRLAARHGANLILHGHKHRAFMGRTLAYELPDKAHMLWAPGNINVVGGGSAGSTDTSDGRCFFNLLKLSGGVVTLEMYRSESQGLFERFGSWEFNIEFDPDGKARTGEWRRA